MSLLKKLIFIPTSQGIIISIILFFLIAFIGPVFGPNEQIQVLFGATTFIFGVIIAFYISNSSSRVNEIAQALNDEDSNCVAFHGLIKVFGDKYQSEIRQLLDKYLISQLDYYLYDFDKTRVEFREVERFILGLKPSTGAEINAHQVMLGILRESQHNRIRLASLINQRLLSYEWGATILLSVTILVSLFVMNDHSIISNIVSVLLSSSVILLLLVLRDLNYLVWKQQDWAWNALKETFISIGVAPYYPQSIYKANKASLTGLTKVRVAHYKHPYPDFSDKKIEEIALRE